MSHPSKVIKTAISLSPVVMNWGKALAEEKGFGSNFSGYIADLIRHDKDNAEANRRLGVLSHHVEGNGDGAKSTTNP
jgi:hypothetical protein